MTTVLHHGLTSGGPRRARRLVKGWHDLQQDILMLSTRLALISDRCACHDAKARVKEARGGGAPDPQPTGHCADCDAVVRAIEPPIHALIVDTLRFLLTVMPSLTASTNRPRADALWRQAQAVAEIVGRLRTAIDEYRDRRTASCLETVKQCTHELFKAGRRLNEVRESVQWS